ncbi:uncharacterized protein LOC128556055 [Mercenaria mercenaria]|uniref:uncharacterized protein LOC128556055 n=1 Tax=Mercenaria mercenaria TaxID=6596 RepID=UPI00234E6456|nr:uncharacterized protein LOC128556055 [Mercenaria mercenaria]
MGACEVICEICCFIIFPSFILQSVGLFSPEWVSTSACDSVGLIYSCCTGTNNNSCSNTNGGDELDVRVLGLEATSFAMMFLAVLGISCGTCCNSDDDKTGWCGTLGGCCFILLPVAGLFSFIGCMIIAANYSTSQLGWSFYLCLTSGCFIILLTIIMCCCLRKLMKDDDDIPSRHQPSSSRVMPYEGGGAAAPYGGARVAVAQVEQQAVIHD